MVGIPKVEVYEHAMCCSSGVCGPRVDPVLVQLAADLKWLEEQGVTVERYCLAQAPGAFAHQPVVAEHMRRSFTACLPMVLIDGALAFKGHFPTREQLGARLGIGMRAGR